MNETIMNEDGNSETIIILIIEGVLLVIIVFILIDDELRKKKTKNISHIKKGVNLETGKPIEVKCEYCDGTFVRGLHISCPHCGGTIKDEDKPRKKKK